MLERESHGLCRGLVITARMQKLWVDSAESEALCLQTISCSDWIGGLQEPERVGDDGDAVPEGKSERRPDLKDIDLRERERSPR